MQNMQNMRICPKGHPYDSSLPACPFCLPKAQPPPPPPHKDETIFHSELVDSARVRPVVGWLVCVQGSDIGKDFRLHSDYNHVGHAEGQDVRLSDKTVSGEHFTISHDRTQNQYFAEMNSKGRTMVYINGYSLGGRVALKRGDQIKVGDTLLVFVPLEQQCVKWNWRT